MTEWPPSPSTGSTSAPLDNRNATRDGSLIATLISQGVAVVRFTPQGTVIPFGQNIGTAVDATAVRCDGSDDPNPFA